MAFISSTSRFSRVISSLRTQSGLTWFILSVRSMIYGYSNSGGTISENSIGG